MADEERPAGWTPAQGGERPFSTLPDRPPLRQVAHNPSDLDMKGVAMGVQARSVDARTQARRDAVIAVSRARERAGLPSAIWSGSDIDILHAITDLLLQIQNQDRPRVAQEEPYRA